MPGSPIGLTVRNDYVQHAGTAMLLWAEMARKKGAQGAEVLSRDNRN
jgi:hypothetical protein